MEFILGVRNWFSLGLRWISQEMKTQPKRIIHMEYNVINNVNTNTRAKFLEWVVDHRSKMEQFLSIRIFGKLLRSIVAELNSFIYLVEERTFVRKK